MQLRARQGAVVRREAESHEKAQVAPNAPARHSGETPVSPNSAPLIAIPLVPGSRSLKPRLREEAHR